MLKTKIKASAITNLTDARYYAAWYADWLGFDLRGGREAAFLAQVKAIQAWIEGPVIVGEIDLFDFDRTRAIIDFLELKAIQVGQFSPVDALKRLPEISIFQEYIVETTTALETIERHCAINKGVVNYFLLNFEKNGLKWPLLQQSPHFSIERLKKLCQQYPILLQLADSALEVEKIINEIQPYGLSVSGSEEEKTGYKSFEEIDELFELLAL